MHQHAGANSTFLKVKHFADQRDDQENDQRCHVLLRALTAILPSGKGMRPKVCEGRSFFQLGNALCTGSPSLLRDGTFIAESWSIELDTCVAIPVWLTSLSTCGNDYRRINSYRVCWYCKDSIFESLVRWPLSLQRVSRKRRIKRMNVLIAPEKKVVLALWPKIR